MSLDDLQAQLRGALDQQFAALKQQYDQAVAAARDQARVEAEQQAAARIAAARAELETQMSAIVSATRAEAVQQSEQKARAERHALEKQLEQQLEQTVQHAVNSVKRSSELELEALRRRVEKEVQTERERAEAALNEALQAERERGAAALMAERQRAETTLSAERERVQSEVQDARARGDKALEEERTRLQQAMDEQARHAAEELEAVKQLLEAEIASAQAEAAAAREETQHARADAARAAADAATAAATAAVTPVAAPAATTALSQVPDAIRALDGSASLSQLLESLLQHAGAIAGRAALFLVNGDRLKSWKTAGIPEIDVQTVESSIGGRDLLARAIQSGRTTAASGELPAPPFARFTGTAAVAVPMMVAGRAVAVLYADAGQAEAPAGWADAVDLVARHASAVAALRAATRTLDVLRGDGADPSAHAVNGNGEEGARRYARLLVSEIKLYNEAAVRAGREQRDLRQRLRSEIDRALRLYEERVPAVVTARDQYFQQELVHTLADGDPSLLGT